MNHITQHPDSIAAHQRVRNIAEAISRIVLRIADIEPQLARLQPAPDAVAVADLILADSAYPGAAARTNKLREEHLMLREQLEVLRVAEQRQAEEISKLHQRLSHERCRELLGEHRAIVAGALGALQQLEASQVAEHEFMLALNRAGYDDNGFPERALWFAVGSVSLDPDCALARRIRELKAYVGKAVVISAQTAPRAAASTLKA